MTQILASLKIKHAGFADTDPYNAAISELAMDSSINAVRLTTISSGSFQGDYISDIEIFNGELNLDGYYPKSWLKCAAPYANYKLMGGPELRVKYDLYVFQSRTRLAILDIVNKACLFDGSMIYMGINLYLTHFTEEQLVKMSASDLDAILR
jgi:hypothetical protein